MANQDSKSEVTIVRIYVHEADRGRHKPLMEEILDLLQEQHEVRGVAVFRGIAGLNTGGRVRAVSLKMPGQSLKNSAGAPSYSID